MNKPTLDHVTPAAVIQSRRATPEPKEAIRAALGTLDQQQLCVLGLYYLEHLNYSVIGQILGISRARIRKIHGQALAHIHTRLTEHSCSAISGGR